jgi:hypothetical protein
MKNAQAPDPGNRDITVEILYCFFRLYIIDAGNCLC